MSLLAVIGSVTVYCMILGGEYWPLPSRVAFVLFGVLPLAMGDLKKSAWLRVICTLPIRRDAISRLVWLFPAVSASIAVAMGAVSAVGLGKTPAFDALLAPLEMFMISASVTLAVTFLPMEKRIAIYPLLGLVVLLWVNLDLQLPSTWAMNGHEVVTLALLILCTFASFRYRDRLLGLLSAVNVLGQRRWASRRQMSYAPRTVARVTSRTLPAAWVFLWAFFCLHLYWLGADAGLDEPSREIKLYAWLLYGPIMACHHDAGLRSRLRVYKMLPLSRVGVLFWATKRTLAIFAAICVAACSFADFLSSVGLAFVLLAILFWLGATLVCGWWTLIGWDSIGVVLFAFALLGMFGWHMTVYESVHRIVPVGLDASAWPFWVCWALLGLGLGCLGLGLQFFTLARSSSVYKTRPEK